MARPRKSKASKGAKTKAPKAAKPVDQEVKGSKKASAPDKGPLSGAGHNLTAVKRLILPFRDRYNKILDDKETESASYMADARVLIEDAANDLGCSKRLVRMALQDQRRKMKQDEKESEMDRAEVDQLDTMRDALGLYSDTPLAQAAIKASVAKQKEPKAAANGSGKVVQMLTAEEANEVDERNDDQGKEDVSAAA